MKKPLTALTALSLLFSCGGGGGGGDVATEFYESTTSETTAEESKTLLSGTVAASLVRGIKVCALTTGECVQTDEKGDFTFSSTYYDPQETLTFYAGNVPIAQANVLYNYQVFSPDVMAEGEEETAITIGALLHALAGDLTGSAPTIDLSNVSVETETPIPDYSSLEDVIKQGGEVLLRAGKLFKALKGKVLVCQDETCSSYQEVSWEKPKWLIFYYAAADNNLFSYIKADLTEMQGALTTLAEILGGDREITEKDLTLIAFVDGPEEGDDNLYKFNLETGEWEEIPEAEINGEIESANPSAFAMATAQIFSLYPAERRMLIISSHGDGVKSADVKYVAYDENPYDVLYNGEFYLALRWLGANNYKADLLGFDECLAASSEVLYSVYKSGFLKDDGGVIASEYTESALGWDYKFLTLFAKDEDITPDELGKAVVDWYKEEYQDNTPAPEQMNITLGYFPMQFLQTYAESSQTLWNEAANNSFVWRILGQIRPNLVPVEVSYECSRVDAYSLLEKLAEVLLGDEGYQNCISGCTDGTINGCELHCDKITSSLESLMEAKSLPYTWSLYGYEDNRGEGLPSIFFPYKGLEEGGDYNWYLWQESEYSDGLTPTFNPFTESGWPFAVEIAANNYGISPPTCEVSQ
jgi:hypothetical protein